MIAGTEPQVVDRTGDTLRRRVVSALVLAPVALVIVVLGGWAFTALVILAAALMAYEWDRLCGGEGVGATGLLTAAAVVTSVLFAGAGLYLAALGVLALAGLVAPLVAAWAGRRGLWPTLGVAYVGLPCLAMVWLRSAPDRGLQTMLWLLAVVWATDIGAYFIGRRMGGPRMAPRISPGKTWSGLVGGVACAALVGYLAGAIAGLSRSGALAVAGAGLAVVSQTGDVAESWVKRRFGVKDSGALIPGHGGILDRLDGLLFAALVVALAILAAASAGQAA